MMPGGINCLADASKHQSIITVLSTHYVSIVRTKETWKLTRKARLSPFLSQIIGIKPLEGIRGKWGVAGSKISQPPATAPDFTLLQVGGHCVFRLCLEGISPLMRINWGRGAGLARSSVIIEVVANRLIPSNPDRRPYVSFITSTVKSRWDPHG